MIFTWRSGGKNLKKKEEIDKKMKDMVTIDLEEEVYVMEVPPPISSSSLHYNLILGGGIGISFIIWIIIITNQ